MSNRIAFLTKQNISNFGVLVLVIAIGVGTWSYLLGVYRPYQRDHAQPGTTRGNQSDLYPRWLGARELILNGRNPYSAEVTREIQIGYYGRAVDPSNSAVDEQRFIYPVYIAFLLAPTAMLPFSLVNAGFGILLALLTAASVYLWMRALSLQCRPFTTLLCMLAVLGSWPAAEGLYVRQISLLVAFLVAMAGAEIARGRFAVAGVCLAFSTIKPQLVVPMTAWLLVWACSGWRERKSLVWSFLTSICLLLLSGEVVLPHWYQDWWRSLPAYMAYTGSHPSLERLFGFWLGRILETFLVLIVMVLCWRLRKHPAESNAFSFALALTLSATLVLMPTWSLASYNEVLLLPAILWVLAAFRYRTILTPSRVFLLIFGAVVVAWGSLAAGIIAVVSGASVLIANEAILRIPVYLYFLVPTMVTVVLIAMTPTTLLASEQA